MAAQRGGALLLKVDVSGTMTTIGGLRSTTITINDEAVDVTNKDSGGSRNPSCSRWHPINDYYRLRCFYR